MRPKPLLAGFLVVVAIAALAGIRTSGDDAPSPRVHSAPSPTAQDGPCGAPIVKADGKPWRCTFADDFGGNALDPTKWGPSTTAMSNLSGTGDCWISNPDNISVSNGALHLTTRRTPTPFPCTTADGRTFQRQVTSGSVTSSGRFAQAFGRWEIRARFPHVTAPGSHSALWLYPQDRVYGRWPISGEIDIAEFYSRYPDRVIPIIHYKVSRPDATITNNECFVDRPWEFHTYTVLWTRGRILITIDGRTCVDHLIHPAAPLTDGQPFDQPFMINLTQALGIGPNTATAATPFPLTTDIDYVRVWA
jgi:beta-glucanase (GH16 family)